MIRVALLDLNNNHPNQGMGNIIEVAQAFKSHAEEPVDIEVFDVRYKNEIPKVEDFDIFISSGGPGNPHKEGKAWEQPFEDFLNGIWAHNQKKQQKKFLFLICHSYQVACIYWDIAEVTERKSYSFGVLPMHKTQAGKEFFLFQNLPDPFYAVDSRAYQVVQPKKETFENRGIEILALEKIRPNIPLERAIMSIRFSDEIIGTQFHPEANPEGFLKALKVEKYKNSIIEEHGLEKYQRVVDRIDDEDKVVLTRREILPSFLKYAASQLKKEVSLSES